MVSINKEIQFLSNKLSTLVARREEAISRQNEVEKQINAIDIITMEESNIALHKLSEQQRARARKEVEELCTYALQYAISPDLEAHIELTTLRNKPAASLYIYNKVTGLRSSPLESNGGGIVDTVSSALVLIIAEIWKDPEIDGPMIFDEAYKHVSKEYAPLISKFLKQLVDDFDRQIILCTHNDYISQAADTQIYVSLDGEGVSNVVYQ